MPSLPTFPPLDGTLTLLPGLVDFQAEHNPDLPWAKFPSPDSPTEIISVSFSEYAKASHRVAHAARPLGDGFEGRDGEVVAVLLQTDSLLYLAVLAGLARAGLVVRHIRAFPPIMSTIEPFAISGLPHITEELRISGCAFIAANRLPPSPYPGLACVLGLRGSTRTCDS